MGEHKLGSITRTSAQTLNIDGKKTSNHSTRKSVVEKLKKAEQPRHKIIQIMGHTSKSSLDNYDKINEGERELFHIIRGYLGTASSATTSLPTSTIVHPLIQLSSLSSQSHVPSQMLFTRIVFLD